jgi:thiol-disulfide isomerase/thioredoxin
LLHQASVTLLALTFAIGACHRGVAPESKPAALRLVNSEGLEEELQSKRGRPVFVNFWATWCEPCMAEFPDLVKAAREWRPRGIAFVSVSADEATNLTPIQTVLERFGAAFDSVFVASGDIDALIRQIDAEWTGALPASFLYDASGEKVRKQLGSITPQMLETWFRAISSESPRGTRPTCQ